MAYNFTGLPAASITATMGMGPIGTLTSIPGGQNFMELANQGFQTLPPPIPIRRMNDSSLEFTTNQNQSSLIKDILIDNGRSSEKLELLRDREIRDNRDHRRRSRVDRESRDRDRDRRDGRSERSVRDDRRPNDHENIISTTINNNQNSNSKQLTSTANSNTNSAIGPLLESSTGVWTIGIGCPMVGISTMGRLIGEMPLGPRMGQTHLYGPMGMGMISHESIVGAPILGPEQILNEVSSQLITSAMPPSTTHGKKEIIHCKSCTLFPPNPNALPPSTRERPPGCRTIFVGGLPENITECIIQEIFERYGKVTTLRLSKKNFCHIRFTLERSVDASIYLSGYRLRIGSNGDSSNTGRLHVDFAQARDDQYEWECRQRQLQREQRHRERVEKERQRQLSSPPPVVHYTDHEASNICEKIKQEDTFMKAVQIVITWLERGDCTKRNSNTFYSMIQSTNSHVRRLLTEKVTYEDEVQKAKEILKGRMQRLLIQFGQIERVFSAASHKKVWDHFTKAQRKNIEMWKKQSSEIKVIQLEETLIEGEGEMEVSDSEDEPQRKKNRVQSIVNEKSERFQTLKEENDSLRCQLEAYENEVDLLKSETKVDIEAKDKQIKILQQTLNGTEEKLMQSRKQQAQDDKKIKELIVKLNVAKKEEIQINEVITLDKEDDINNKPPTLKHYNTSSDAIQMTQKDAKLIGLIAIFLHIHPFGASLDYVYYYLQKIEPGLRLNEVESLMQRFPQIFKQELSGIGANMERRWQFSGFNLYRSY